MVEPAVNATDKAMNLRPFVICFAQDVQSPGAEAVIGSFNRDCGLFYFQFPLDFLRIIVGSKWATQNNCYYCEDPIKTFPNSRKAVRMRMRRAGANDKRLSKH